MNKMVWLYLILGLALLGFGGDMLVQGSVKLAQKMKLSPLLIGIVLVGFGTSTPELLTTIMAVFQTPPSTGMAVGNIVGTNIVNILLVLGLTAAISPIIIDKRSFERDGIFLVLASLMLSFGIIAGVIGTWLGLIMFLTLIGYVVYCYSLERKIPQKPENNAYRGPLWRAFLITICGIAMTILGARWLVDSSIEIARYFGVSETLIGLTVIAVGTSLPEIATSMIASIRKHNEIAFGNIVGSNIYNTLFILGIVAIFSPITIPSGIDVSFVIMAFATMLLLYLGARGRIGRFAGFVLLALYGLYLYWLI